MKHKRKSRRDEQPSNLLFWIKDGFCIKCDARTRASTEVSIGRTDSKRALGFLVTRGKAQIDFVLDRDQINDLAAYLRHCPPLLAPRGRKRKQLSLAAMWSPENILSVKRRRKRKGARG
jgi:hypothetical protein